MIINCSICTAWFGFRILPNSLSLIVAVPLYAHLSGFGRMWYVMLENICIFCMDSSLVNFNVYINNVKLWYICTSCAYLSNSQEDVSSANSYGMCCTCDIGLYKIT